MRPQPDVTFARDNRYGLVAKSSWEQAEARTVLRDLGWEWEEHAHALIPPEDVDPADAGVQAVLELHRHGHQTGYLQGPYGTMRVRLAEADRIFTQMTTRGSAVPQQQPTTDAEAPYSSYASRHDTEGQQHSAPFIAPPL